MGTLVHLYPAQEPVRLDKQFANLQAQAAIMGATLHRVEDDRGNEVYVVSKWNLCRQLPSLCAVSDWLDKLRGP